MAQHCGQAALIAIYTKARFPGRVGGRLRAKRSRFFRFPANLEPQGSIPDCLDPGQIKELLSLADPGDELLEEIVALFALAIVEI